MNSRSRWPIILGLFLAMAAGAIAGSIVTIESRHLPFMAARTVPVRVSDTPLVRTGDLSINNGFASVVSAVLPAVVNIASSKIVRSQNEQSLPFVDPLRQFFGNRPPRERRERSLGSGVIVSPEGYILTNNHVVGGAAEIIVTLSDTREFKARIIGTDPQTDVAVVKLDLNNLPVFTLGDSSDVHVGDFVLAVGSPFGLSQTVTMGIISAKGRINLGIEDYENFIQTDTAINPGNSGGALVNVRGELIGINTAILSSGTNNQGVGFAIPIDMAQQIMTQILKNGRVIRAYMGAWIQPVTPEYVRFFHLPKPEGVLLGDVEQGSPAAKGGLQRGDVIVEKNGEPIKDSQEFRMQIAMSAPGTMVKMKYFRDGGERNTAIKLTELPAKDQSFQSSKESLMPGSLQGIDVEKLTPGAAHRLGLSEKSQGALVVNVEAGSPADNAGLQRGDVIQEINRKPIAEISDFQRAVANPTNSPVLLLVNRQGTTLYMVVNY
jgi:serine protease Do